MDLKEKSIISAGFLLRAYMKLLLRGASVADPDPDLEQEFSATKPGSN